MPQQKSIVNDDDWVDDEGWEDDPPPTQQAALPPAEPGFISRVWDTISTPLTTAPSRVAQSISNWIDPDDPIRGRSTGGLRGVTSAFIESLGNVGSQMTSPIDATAMALTGGASGAARAGLPTIARGLTTGARVASAPVVAHGAMTMTDPNASWGERALGLAELAGGGAGVAQRVPTRARVNPTVARSAVQEVPPVMPERPFAPVVERPPDIPAQVMDDGPVPVMGDDVDELIKGLDNDPNQQVVDMSLDESAGPLNNASGDSDASLEAIRRAQSLKQKGQQFVVYNKAGEKKIIGRGVDAHDYVAQGYLKPGESFGLESADGSFQLLDDRGGKIPSAKEPKPPTAASKTDQFLQRDLQGAKPRFNIGTESYSPQFANDLDKALYIIAQKNPSRRDADFLRFVMEQTGMDEAAARAAGMDIRRQIHATVKGQPAGPVTIPQIFGRTQKPPVTQVTPETLAGGGSGAPPPIKPPMAGQPPPTPPPPSVPPTQVAPQLAQLNQQASLANPTQKAGLFQNTQAFIRTLMTSYDISAPGRQGKGLITHGGFWRSFDDMFRAWGSENAAKAVQDSIVNHPSGFFQPTIKIKSGVNAGKFTSIAEQAGLAYGGKQGRPEMFGSKLAEKLPGVKASERAYTAFLDKARSDVFAKLYGQAVKEGRGTSDVARQIADSINISTGIGRLGDVAHSETAMKALSNIFFAPKLMASRVQMYTRVLNPKTYYAVDPIVRKEALRSLFGIVGTGLVLGEVAQGLGAKVSNDPTNTDFRKIKIGNSRIDNFSGLQQYGVAAVRFLTGQSTSSVSGRTSNLEKPKFGGQTRQDVVQNFLTNKLAPIPSFVWAWMGNKEFDGTPFDAKQAMLQRTVPLVIQDLLEIAKEDPSLIPLGLLPLIGEGVQTYGR
jgi:hypothetical protein